MEELEKKSNLTIDRPNGTDYYYYQITTTHPLKMDTSASV